MDWTSLIARNQLVDEVYEPIAIATSGEGRFRGAIARLWRCTCAGRKAICASSTPVTESYLRTNEEDESLARAGEERAGRMEAQSRVEGAQTRANIAQNRAEAA